MTTKIRRLINSIIRRYCRFLNYTAVDGDGRLVVPAEDNRVSLNSRPLLTPHRTTLFGARGWLITLYAVLVGFPVVGETLDHESLSNHGTLFH